MLNNEFPPLGGGTGTVNLELFRIFQTIPNLKVDLISSAGGQNKEIEQFSENIRILKYPVGKKDIHHASNFELIRYAIKSTFVALKLNRKEKYDLVFVWSTVPAGFPSILLKLFKKLPFILRVGGPDIPGFEERYNFIYKIITPFIKFVWKRASIIVAKCKIEKEMVENINPNLKIQIINNGIDTSKFSYIEKDINSELRIICSARLIKRKGQYTLIDAMVELKSKDIKIHIDFVGEGDEKQAYINYAKEKDVLEQIIFSGYVPREDMPEKYQKSDIFVLPSFNEGMSNSLLEAMACGLPVVVTNVGGTEELVDASNGYIFKAGDSQALSKILEQLYKSKQQIKILGQNSRNKAEQHNWEYIANEYLKLFNKISV